MTIFLQRLDEQKSELSYNEEDRVKWQKVFVTGMISSDESEEEDGEFLLVQKNCPREVGESQIFLQNWTSPQN